MEIRFKIIVTFATSFVIATVGLSPALSQQAAMSFFLTSANPGKGGDLGGLAGADQYCEKLAAAAGVAAGGKKWRAYLSGAASAATAGTAHPPAPPRRRSTARPGAPRQKTAA